MTGPTHRREAVEARRITAWSYVRTFIYPDVDHASSYGQVVRPSSRHTTRYTLRSLIRSCRHTVCTVRYASPCRRATRRRPENRQPPGTSPPASDSRACRRHRTGRLAGRVQARQRFAALSPPPDTGAGAQHPAVQVRLQTPSDLRVRMFSRTAISGPAFGSSSGAEPGPDSACRRRSCGPADRRDLEVLVYVLAISGRAPSICDAAAPRRPTPSPVIAFMPLTRAPSSRSTRSPRRAA